jgi:hypothetical protein
MLVVRALKITQMTDGGMPPTYDSMHYLTTGRSIAADPSVSNFLLEIRSAEPLNFTGHAYGYEFLFFLSYFRTK